MIEAQEKAIIARSHIAFTHTQPSCENTPSNSQYSVSQAPESSKRKTNKFIDDEAEENHSVSSHSTESIVGEDVQSDETPEASANSTPKKTIEEQRALRRRLTIIESEDEDAQLQVQSRRETLINQLNFDNQSTSTLTDISDNSEYDTEPEEDDAVRYKLTIV